MESLLCHFRKKNGEGQKRRLKERKMRENREGEKKGGDVFKQIKKTILKIYFKIKTMKKENIIYELHPCVCYKRQTSN